MTNYTKNTTFTTKDNLDSGNPDKLLVGSEFDAEFDEIATSIATKYESGDIASQAVAEAGASNTTLMTPLRTQQWAADNDGMVADIRNLDLSADAILGWDESESEAIGYALGNGIETSTTTLQLEATLAGDLLDYSSGVLSLTDVTAGANNPMNLSGTAWTCDITALGAATMTGIAATDTILIDDGGVASKIEIQELGMRAQTGQTTQTLAAADMNSIMEFTGTATLTLPINSGVALPIGVPIVLNVKHATQELTVTAATSVTLVSTFHPGGGSAASDTVRAGGTAVLYKTAADVWCLGGDITT